MFKTGIVGMPLYIEQRTFHVVTFNVLMIGDIEFYNAGAIRIAKVVFPIFLIADINCLVPQFFER